MIKLYTLVAIGACSMLPSYGMGIAWGDDDEVTKSVDLADKVDSYVTQDYEYWCVYAAMESLNKELQCNLCCDYVRMFHDNASDNKYGSTYIPDQDYADAINKLIASQYNAACSVGEVYEKFGVIASDLDEYLKTYGINENNGIVSNISQKEDIEPALAIETSGPETNHCNVISGYEVYNDDWFDSRSVIYIHNPEYMGFETISLDELNHYAYIYQ